MAQIYILLANTPLAPASKFHADAVLTARASKVKSGDPPAAKTWLWKVKGHPVVVETALELTVMALWPARWPRESPYRKYKGP